jgi:hypothetical protein
LLLLLLQWRELLQFGCDWQHRQADIQGYPTVCGMPSTTKAIVNGAQNKCRNGLKSQQQRQAKRCSTNDACRF